MKTKTILTCLLLCISAVCYPQAGKLFTADSELSNSLINQVYQDRNGIIWVTTEDGLNRYDGSKFTIYKHDADNPNSLINNYVRTIYEDRKGRFFIGTFKGLQIYDDATDTFQEIPMFLSNGQRFNPHVISIIERKNEDFLIGTGGLGLFRLTTHEGEMQARQVQDLIPSNLINYMFEDKDDNLWVSTDVNGLYCLTPQNQRKHYAAANGKSLNAISAICEDRQGKLYIAGMGIGLYAYDKLSDSFAHIPCPGYSNLPIKSLHVNKENEILIGTDGAGMKMYIPGSPQITESNISVTTFDFAKAKIHSIIEDRSGNTWMGIFQRGVMMLPERSNNFKYIGYKSARNNTIGSNCVMSLCRDSEGMLWVGTDSDGLYGLDSDGKCKVHFAPTQESHSIPSIIMCIYEDSNRDIWIGSYLNGLARLNRKTGKCEYIRLVDEYAHDIQHVYSVVEDNDKNLWIGTMGAGLFCLNLRTQEVSQYNSEHDPDQIIHNKWINTLMLSRDNRLYIGTYDGIACLDLKTKSFTSAYNTQWLLPGGYVVYTLCEDKTGDIWAGTSTGLVHLHLPGLGVSKYTMKDGLPNDVICAIQSDADNNLWITTNYGLSCMNVEKRTFVNYYANEGLQGNEFSKKAACIDQNKQFVFGGINGITCFNPQEITHEKKQLQVRITGFYIHDVAVKKGMKSGSYNIIDSSVLDARKFHLSYKDNSFSIEFATKEFSDPQQITYMYAMDSNNWISLQPGANRVTFSDLAPGVYHFKIKANEYGTDSEEEAFTIVISPAWYVSGWAKLAYVLIAAGIIFLVVQQVRHRYQARQRLQQHVHEQEINEAKLQFFINISHEIRTPLSLIISPLKKLMAIDKDNDRQSAYFTMHRNSERILQLINQLLDIRKIDKGQMLLKCQEVEMVTLTEDICSLFDDQIKAKQIDLQFHHPMAELNAWVDPNNFDKILMNVLSNAIKFTPKNGAISLQLNTLEGENAPGNTRREMEWIVSDNGPGINESEVERIFERFYQTRNTPRETEGTGVGLHLTRSLVELHHGTIKAENNPDGLGCRFIIRLPLGNAHLKPEEIDTTPAPISRPAQPQVVPVEKVLEEETKIRSKTKWYVMVVDDDKEIRKYICRELASEFHTIECANGKEALAKILEKAPDLVISDVVMPEMDGITLCRKIRQNVKINHLPVILLTAKSKEEDNLEGLETGADAYISKPFNMDILRKTVVSIIRNREMLRNTFSGNQHQKDKIKTITIKSADDKLLEKVMKVINDNLSNTDLNVEMIATQVGISRVHLHRKLKELTNQSTRDLIRNIRLQQAATLLSTKSLSVTEVATATGFTNLTYFSNAFKEMHGLPPIAYMEARLSSQSSEKQKSDEE